MQSGRAERERVELFLKGNRGLRFELKTMGERVERHKAASLE